MRICGTRASSVDQASALRRIVDDSGRSVRSIAVTSGKGGVGKTNIAVNLAVYWASLGRDVTLVDLDVGLANADVLLNVHPRFNLSHVQAGQRSIAEIAVETHGGLRFVAGGSGVDGLADMSDSRRRRLVGHVDSIRDQADLVVYDCGAGISMNVLAFALMADAVLVVSTPDPTAITDAYAMVKVLVGKKYHGSLRLLVNMASDRNEAAEVYRRIAEVAERFLHFTLADGGYVLQDTRVELAVRRRSPFVLSDPRCPSSLCIAALAANLAPVSRSSVTPPGLLSRFVELFS